MATGVLLDIKLLGDLSKRFRRFNRELVRKSKEALRGLREVMDKSPRRQTKG